MSARQSFALLGALSVLVQAALAGLSWRLGMCLPVDPGCMGASISGICRLLQAIGIEMPHRVLGDVLGGMMLVLPVVGLVAVTRRWYRTTAFLRVVRRRLVTPLPDEVARVACQAGVRQPIELVDLAAPLAFVHGVRCPRICLSTGLLCRLDSAELGAVLRHEQIHVARRDPLRMLLGHALATMICWLPLARALEVHLQVASEIEADAVVAQRPDGQITLARALGKLLTVDPDARTMGRYAVSGLTATERRIDALLAGNQRVGLVVSRSGAAISIVAVLALICLLLI